MIKIKNLEKIYRTEDVETVALNKISIDVNLLLTPYAERIMLAELTLLRPNNRKVALVTPVTLLSENFKYIKKKYLIVQK